MSEPNAIERIEDALVDGDQGRKAREALAAVDALYQAAKEWRRAEDDTSWGPNKDWHKRHDKNNARRALREAIDRVEGQA